MTDIPGTVLSKDKWAESHDHKCAPQGYIITIKPKRNLRIKRKSNLLATCLRKVPNTIFWRWRDEGSWLWKERSSGGQMRREPHNPLSWAEQQHSLDASKGPSSHKPASGCFKISRKHYNAQISSTPSHRLIRGSSWFQQQVAAICLSSVL